MSPKEKAVIGWLAKWGPIFSHKELSEMMDIPLFANLDIPLFVNAYSEAGVLVARAELRSRTPVSFSRRPRVERRRRRTR